MLWPPRSPASDPSGLITRAIPSTGQRLPVIGVGTNSFTESKRDELRQVLRRMVELGGSVVDTAPVYGESEQVLGELIAELGIRDRIFLGSQPRFSLWHGDRPWGWRHGILGRIL